MSFNCARCDRSFGSQQALGQHQRDAPLHGPIFVCTSCERSFGSDEALKQHCRDALAHSITFECEGCAKSFATEQSLEQHRRDAPAHKPTFDCESCNRAFGSEEALEQHRRDAPAHKPTFDCESCDRAFGSAEALEKHLRDAPVHNKPLFECKPCDRAFGSEEALERHQREARIHQQASESPLDVFFRSFPTFKYDRALPPATSYANLETHMGWHRGQSQSSNAWIEYQDALEREFEMWFGAEDDLVAWHALCRAIGIKPLPTTCGLCKKVRTTEKAPERYTCNKAYNRLHVKRMSISLI